MSYVIYCYLIFNRTIWINWLIPLEVSDGVSDVSVRISPAPVRVSGCDPNPAKDNNHKQSLTDTFNMSGTQSHIPPDSLRGFLQNPVVLSRVAVAHPKSPWAQRASSEKVTRRAALKLANGCLRPGGMMEWCGSYPDLTGQQKEPSLAQLSVVKRYRSSPIFAQTCGSS